MNFVGIEQPLELSNKSIGSASTPKALSVTSTVLNNTNYHATADDTTNIIQSKEKNKSQIDYELRKNTIETVDCINDKLNVMENTLLQALHQIAMIREDVTNVVTSNQHFKHSRTTDKITTMHQESCHESADLCSNSCKVTYLKQDRHQHLPHPGPNASPQLLLPKSETIYVHFPISSADLFLQFNVDLNNNVELREYTVSPIVR